MWIRNCWYVAAFAEEVERKILARTFLNEAVILWRTAAGRVVAMEDRCPHRLVPLSVGDLVDDHVQCGYHGLRFDAAGACAHAPGQDAPPRACKVATFPVAERHGLVWIWLGPTDLADENLIPDVHWMSGPGWTASKGYHHIEADFRLVNDNLLDLSHETYVHKETIGNGAVADSPVVATIEEGRVVRDHREMPNIIPPPFFAMMLNASGRINRWQVAIHMPPGINMTEAGFHAVGTDRAKALMIRPLHLLTPETEHSTHYFWGTCRNFNHDDPVLTERIREGTAHTFDQDKTLLEIQDRALRARGMPPIPQAALKVDVAPAQGRRLLAALVEREKADPRAVAPPITIAVDDRTTMPPTG